MLPISLPNDLQSAFKKCLQREKLKINTDYFSWDTLEFVFIYIHFFLLPSLSMVLLEFDWSGPKSLLMAAMRKKGINTHFRKNRLRQTSPYTSEDEKPLPKSCFTWDPFKGRVIFTKCKKKMLWADILCLDLWNLGKLPNGTIIINKHCPLQKMLKLGVVSVVLKMCQDRWNLFSLILIHYD